MIRQSTSKSAAPSAAPATANAVVWAIYAALVAGVPWVLAFSDPVAVTASVLVAAVAFLPLRRRMSRAARRRFTRLPGSPRRPRGSSWAEIPSITGTATPNHGRCDSCGT